MPKEEFEDLLTNEDLKGLRKYILGKNELKKPRELSDEEKNAISFRRKAGWSWFNPIYDIKKRDVTQQIQNPYYRAAMDTLGGTIPQAIMGLYLGAITKGSHGGSISRGGMLRNPLVMGPALAAIPEVFGIKGRIERQKLYNDVAEEYMKHHQEGQVVSMGDILKDMMHKKKNVSSLSVNSKKVKTADLRDNLSSGMQALNAPVNFLSAILSLRGAYEGYNRYKENRADVEDMRERFRRKMQDKAEADVFLTKVRKPLYRKGLSNEDKIEDFENMFKSSSDKSPILPHQQRIIDKLEKEDQPGLILMHGLGSGKTRSSIEAYKKLGLPAEVLLPAALKGNYEKEIKKWVGKTPKDINIRSQQEVARKGINPEDFKDKLMIVDEAHRLRNEDTKLYKAIKNAPAKKRVLLTGTPIYNHPSDIAKLINVAAGKEIMPERRPEFENEFIGQKVVFPSLIHRVLGVKPGQELSVKNKDYLKAVFKKLVDYHGGNAEGFPDVSKESVKVPMSSNQQQIYKAMMKELPWYMRLKVQAGLPPDKKELDKLIPFLSGARMISNTTKGFVKDDKAISSPKIEKAFEFLKSKIDEDPSYKGLIYSNYLNSGVEPYKALLQKANIPFGEFTGDINDKVRNQLVKDYNDNKLKALIVSSAGGEGLDLKGTRLVQLLEPHFNNEKIKQVIGRAARYKSHEALDPEKRNVLIQNYLSTLTPGMLDKITSKFTGSKNLSTDEYLQNLADEKEKLNNEFVKLIKGDQEKTANINTALQTVFGNNAIPRPENGESMYDALLKQRRDIESRDIAGEQLLNNPIAKRLNIPNSPVLRSIAGLVAVNNSDFGTKMAPFMGGNTAQAASNLHQDMQGANMMGNFGRLTGVTSSESKNAIEQAKKQFYKQDPSEADGNAKTSSEKLVGGKGDRKPDELFSKKELAKGKKHELEHTKNKSLAKEIAKDHLTEKADYYTAMHKAKLGSL